MDVYIDSSQFNEFQNKIQKLSEEFRDEVINEITEETNKEILKQIQENTPVVTGNLRAGWETEIKETSNGYHISVSNDVEYAPYVEYGHRTRGGKSFVKGQYILIRTLANIEDTMVPVADNIINNFFRRI